MRRLVVGLAISLAPAFAAGQTADQFDLDCVGAYHNSTGAGDLTNRRYHIDLKASRWCYDQCAQPQAFTSITADLLTLERPPLARPDIAHTINRQTGGLYDNSGGGVYFQGTCTKAAFTPLPEPKF
jgi:hypothetical protein